MPSTIAFFLCLAFVTGLLILDHRRSKVHSMMSWIPTIWMLYCGSRPLAQWFKSSQTVEDLSAAIIEGSAMDRTFISIMIVIGILILLKREIDWNQVIKDNRWLLLLFLYMLVSILWSDYPFVSFKRWIKVFGSILMALIVLTGPSPFEEIESILRRMVYILIPFSVFLVKYFPQLGMKWGKWSGAPMWAGVALSKNTLGALCMIAALFLIWMWAKRRNQTERPPGKYETIAHVVVLCMTFWLLGGPGGAYSATSVVILIFGLATIFMLRRLKTSANLGAMACLFLLVTGLVYLLMWGFLSLTPVSVVAWLTDRDATLTGRTNMIWSQLIPVALEHPVLGLGYGAFWIHPLEFDKLTVNEAHNGYLDVFIELGAVGLILLGVVIVTFFRKSIDVFKYDIEWGSFLITFLLMSLMHNITESSYLKSTAFIWNVFILSMIGCSSRVVWEQSHSKKTL